MMNDLVKRLNFTVNAGVIGPGSSHHEYHVAESQVREAISLIKALARQNEKLEKENEELRAADNPVWLTLIIEALEIPPGGATLPPEQLAAIARAVARQAKQSVTLQKENTELVKRNDALKLQAEYYARGFEELEKSRINRITCDFTECEWQKKGKELQQRIKELEKEERNDNYSSRTRI